MSDVMMFPETVDEFMESYKMVDTEHIYSNGTEFVPIFRMKQWFEHIDAEPVRRGYWVTTWNRYDKDGYVIQTRGKCSCCNQYSEVLDYCGNCGAKMDEVDE